MHMQKKYKIDEVILLNSLGVLLFFSVHLIRFFSQRKGAHPIIFNQKYDIKDIARKKLMRNLNIKLTHVISQSKIKVHCLMPV